MPEQRTVAGLTCGDVLSRLSDYLDGEIRNDEASRIEDHLRGCDWCEKFGGELTAIVEVLRRELSTAPPLDHDVESRLKSRLAAVMRR